jgi:hypothetical protein
MIYATEMSIAENVKGNPPFMRNLVKSITLHHW